AGAGAAQRTDRQLLDDFSSRNDAAAFEALVRRHGPLVWGLCRSVLGHEQDAEDAFQATFLTLARKAASVRASASLAGGLDGVGYRTALQARRAAARRREHEGKARPGRQPGAAWEAAWREVRSVLAEEVERLPEKYRAVFVLCCLDGRGRAECAGLLG